MLFTVAGIMLCLPLTVHVIKSDGEKDALGGSFSYIERPVLSLEKWLKGEYQDHMERYASENVGLRPMFIRIHNQIAYTVHNYARANSIIIGKKNFLHGQAYIDAYVGKDFIGHDSIREKVFKLKKIQDTLARKNISLAVILAPGKASFYPETIPDRYLKNGKETTNYEVYLEELQKQQVNHLDLKHWFLQMKDTSRYPLFPKGGIHWSHYGEVLAADTILNYVEQLTQLPFADVVISGMETSRRMRFTDEDIEDGMNLLFDVPDLEMAYPHYRIEPDTSGGKPKVLAVSDSYYWGMYNWGFSKVALNGGEFWYYHNDIHPAHDGSPRFVKDENILENLEKHRAVILISTDANLYKFAYGFIEDIYQIYYSGDTLSE